MARDDSGRSQSPVPIVSTMQKRLMTCHMIAVEKRGATFRVMESPPSRLADASLINGQLMLHYVGRNLYRLRIDNSGLHRRTLFISTLFVRRSVLAPRSLLVKNRAGQFSTLRVVSVPRTQKVIHIRVRTTSDESYSVSTMEALPLHTLMRRYPHLPKPILADLRHGRALNAAVADAQSMVAHTQSKITVADGIIANYKNSLTSMKKVSSAYNKLALLLIKEDTAYAQLSKQLAQEKAAVSAAVNNLTRFWQHVRIKKIPIARH